MAEIADWSAITTTARLEILARVKSRRAAHDQLIVARPKI
jgi:predicted Fe-S protein YdhL (DUF1289 family)